MRKKISDLIDFVGKDLLLEAQRRGEEVAKESDMHLIAAADAEIIGLCILLAEKGILTIHDEKT